MVLKTFACYNNVTNRTNNNNIKIKRSFVIKFNTYRTEINEVKMVYLHFPSNLTEEELMLQAKYAKLKKKKKALQALKAPKPEAEKPVLPKRPTEARDAREIARKLIKSGAIQAIKTPPPLPHNTTFKRPRAGRERKLSGGTGATTGGVASYQPFSAAQESPLEEKPTQRVKYLYDSFVTATRGETDEKTNATAPERVAGATDLPKPPKGAAGSTVFISATRVTEDMLRKALAPYGPIVNITVEYEKNKGFITLDKPENAAKAIAELDGTAHDSLGHVRAAFARRQPNSGEPTQPWSSGSHQRKTSAQQQENKRTVLTYDDMFD